jgi:uncharacterized membrane protein
MNKPWKLIVLLVGIFAAGATCGSLVALKVGTRPPPPKPPPSAENWAANHLKRLKEKTGVDAGQLEQIKPIVERRMQEIFLLRGRFLDENRALRQVMEREAGEKMNPEQRARYEEMNREFHERARRIEQGERVPPLHGR